MLLQKSEQLDCNSISVKMKNYSVLLLQIQDCCKTEITLVTMGSLW